MARQGGRIVSSALVVVTVVFLTVLPAMAGQERSQKEWIIGLQVLDRDGDLQGMIAWCQQWTKSNPEYEDAWYSLGLAYHSLYRYQDAIDSYREAVRIDPEYAEVWNDLGLAYHNLNRYQDAIDAYRQAVRIDPELFETWSYLGIAYGRDLQRYQDAIKAYRQAILVNPEYAEAWVGLAISYYLSGNRGSAMDALKELRRLDPVRADKLLD